MTSAPTWMGPPQLRCALPADELPIGRQCTASCWALGLLARVFPLLKGTSRSPLGSAIGSDPWSKLHGAPGVSNAGGPKQTGAEPLISTGVDHVTPWSVDIEP